MALFPLIFALPWGCLAASVNVTIDDTYGDERSGQRPTYGPPNTWRPSPVLSADAGGPDLSYAYDASLREYVGSDSNGTIVFEFNGTSISIYVVTLTSEFRALSPGPFTFFLDHAATPARQYTSPPNLSVDLYRQLAYQSSPLPLSTHTLRVVVPPSCSIYFDYAVYETDDTFIQSAHRSRSTLVSLSSSIILGAPPTESVSPDSHRTERKTPLGVAIAVSVAGVIGLVAVCSWLGVRRRRRQRHSLVSPEEDDTNGDDSEDSAGVTPFVSHPDPAISVVAPKDDKTRWAERRRIATPPQSPFAPEVPAVEVMAELARVRAENARTRAEIAVLREATALPPPYSDGERSERRRSDAI